MTQGLAGDMAELQEAVAGLPPAGTPEYREMVIAALMFTMSRSEAEREYAHLVRASHGQQPDTTR